MTLPLDISNLNTLRDAMAERALATVGASWTRYSDAVNGYLRDLSTDAAQTAQQLASGAIDEATAREIFKMQSTACRSVVTFSEVTAMQTAQSLLDMATDLIADAIHARTGIDIRG